MKYTDMTPLGEYLERYKGQGLWIHFTRKSVPGEKYRGVKLPMAGLRQRSPVWPEKIGINPFPSHLDPPGIYFYPVDWLLGHERFLQGEQWATNWPQFVIADIDTSGNGFDLTRLTKETIQEIGDRNGWGSAWREHIEKKEVVDYVSELKKPDEFYRREVWGFLKMLNARQEQKTTWSKSLRGLDYILDRKGIILSAEPHQICVMNPRIMKILDRGEQRQTESNDYDKFDHWRYAIVKMFDSLKNRHGGTITWKAKRPTWKIEEGNFNFSITWRDSFSMSGLAMQMAKGDITYSDTIPPQYLREHDFEEVVEKIENMMREARKFSMDGFNPVISVDDAKELLHRVAHWSNVEPEVNIRNKTSSFSVTLERTNGKGASQIKSLVRLSADDKDYTLRAEAKINDRLVYYGSGGDLERLWVSIRRSLEVILPEMVDSGYRSMDHEYINPFLGYVYVSTGLAILQEFENDFYNCDSAELYRQIDRHFSRLGW